MSLIIAAAAPPQVRRGASASASDNSGTEFAGVLAGTPKPGAEKPSNAAVTNAAVTNAAGTPHRLGKPHPAAKMQKVRAEDDRSGTDDSDSIDANAVLVAPTRSKDITGHRAKADETSAGQSVGASDGTVDTAATATSLTASAAASVTAGDPGAGALEAVAATITAANMPAGVGTAAGPAQLAPVPAETGGPATPSAMVTSAAGGPHDAAVATALAVQPSQAGTSAPGSTAPRSKTAPGAPAASGKPVTVNGGSGKPAAASLGGTAFTKSMLTSLQALGVEVPALGWLGGVHATGSSAAGSVAAAPALPDSAADGGVPVTVTGQSVQEARPANGHSVPAQGAATGPAFTGVLAQAGGSVKVRSAGGTAAQTGATPTAPADVSAASATAASASAASVSAASASAATASAQAASQLAQPVPATGLQGAAGQPHAMTSTPTQVWTAAEPLGPQLTSSVLPLRAGGDGSHQLIVALHPEQLGPINVHVRIVGDAMTIQLVSGSQDAHETLRAALPELRHELQAAGLGSAQLSLDGGGTAGFGSSGSQHETFRNSAHPVPTPVAEQVARSTPRASAPRATGAIDSGLDRWL